MPQKPLMAIIDASHNYSFLFRYLNGMPLMYWTIQEVSKISNIKRVVLVCRGEDYREVKHLCCSTHVQSLLPQDFELECLYREYELDEKRKFGDKYNKALYLHLDASAALINTKLLNEAIALASSSPGGVFGVSKVNGLISLKDTQKDVDDIWQVNPCIWVGDSPRKSMSSCEIPLPIPQYIHGISNDRELACAQGSARTNLLLSPKPDIKLFLTDVDGVMTNGNMYYNERGGDLKCFHVHDGMAMQQLRDHGVKTGIITSENTSIVSRRAKKLNVDFVEQGRRFGGKLQAAQSICEQEGITLKEVAYIGDDINCISLLSQVGIAACPSNATRQVKSIPGIWELDKPGGEGVVREFIEKLFPSVI